MTYCTSTPRDFIPVDGDRSSRKALTQAISGAIAVALSALLGAWMLYVALPADGGRVIVGPRVAAAPRATATGRVAAALHVDKAPALTPAAVVTPNVYGALLDPASSSGIAPVFLRQGSPLGSSFELASAAPLTTLGEAAPAPPDVVAELTPAPPAAAEAPLREPRAASAETESVLPTPAVPEVAQSVPVPTPRPPELRSSANRGLLRPPSRQAEQQNRTTVLAATPPDNRSFFEKLFGTSQRSGPDLAYAAPDGGLPSNSRNVLSGGLSGYDRQTAVYDISAHTVYLPDGTRLEAHSGLGNKIDDPRYVHERDRGATPPHVYDLGVRTELFHGVQALRLTPIGDGDIFGRTGILAHTYMLGPSGQSNGCVSFRNYNAFLQAFLNGQVKRLAVVARLN
jgi:hypothetical protein